MLKLLFMICLLGVTILSTILIFGFETVPTVWYFLFFIVFSNSNVLPLTDYAILASNQSITRIHCPYYCAVHFYAFISVIACGLFEWKTKLSSVFYILFLSVLS